MACGAYSRRKLYRLFTVKSALVGVPVVWLIFIWWTIYYTQTVEKVQSMKQLTLTSEQQDRIDALNYFRDMSEFTKAVPAPGRDTQSEKEQVKKNAGLPRLQANENILRKPETPAVLLHEKSSAEIKEDSLEIDRKVYKDENVAVTRTPGEKLIQLSDKTISNTSQYVEFIWKADKPKPAKKIIIEGKRTDPAKLGEFGTAVKIDTKQLSERQRQLFDEGWKNHQFNEYVSLQISIQRQTPEYRLPECRLKKASPNLQKASIIICFFNEAWSVLLRTVSSVLTRSPPELIEEIILVDDYSNFVMMGEALENFVGQVDKLRLLRMTARSGLVRARLAGVKAAKGPILIFLDSHVECAEGWLEPLLQTILENPKFAVTPEIDVIDHKDFSIHAAVDNIGVFSFNGLQFDWSHIIPRIKNSRDSPIAPIKSPAMAGGLFAINKEYFESIGTYDPGLEVWGGENIELSLKLWMCGGGIFIHPCSRVSHIFRDESPYISQNTISVLTKNSARVAQVWVDQYRDLYFNGVPYDEEKYGSVQERIELRERLQCHSFSWYLENIFPELYIRGVGRFRGNIKSETGLCITPAERTEGTKLYLEDCSKAHSFESSRIKEIRFSTKCVGIRGTSHLVLDRCDLSDMSQTFDYTENNSLHHRQSNSCITASSHGPDLRLKPCTGERLQIWHWPDNSNFIPP